MLLLVRPQGRMMSTPCRFHGQENVRPVLFQFFFKLPLDNMLLQQKEVQFIAKTKDLVEPKPYSFYALLD